MVVMAPTDRDSSELQELTAMVEGTVTPGEIIKIDTTKAIKKVARTPLAWLLALIVSFFSEYFKGNYDTKFSIGGTVQKPSPDAVPKDSPQKARTLTDGLPGKNGFEVTATNTVLKHGKYGYKVKRFIRFHLLPKIWLFI